MCLWLMDVGGGIGGHISAWSSVHGFPNVLENLGEPLLPTWTPLGLC